MDKDEIVYIDSNKPKKGLGDLDGFTKKFLYEPALIDFLDKTYKNLKLKRPPYRSLKPLPRLRIVMNHTEQISIL